MAGIDSVALVVFLVVIVVSMWIDFYCHRENTPPSLISSTLWSIFWIVISIGFGVFLYFHESYGPEYTSLFFSGYLLEKALSIDNLFVIMAIFSWFSIPEIYRRRVLYLGILGAFVFRLIFVLVGANALIFFGPYSELLFSFMVFFAAIMMLKGMVGNDQDHIEDYSNHIAYRLVKKIFPLYPKLHGNHFFIRKSDISEQKINNNDSRVRSKKLYATPLFLCLVVIEFSDIMFAFDSVPAVIAVSKDPLIIYSAMVFSILGLRSLYFVLESLKNFLSQLEKAVMVLLLFISGKLALSATDHWFHHGIEISANQSLIVVIGILISGVILSFIFPQKDDFNKKDLI